MSGGEHNGHGEHHEPKTFKDILDHASHVHHESDLDKRIDEILKTADLFSKNERFMRDLSIGFDKGVYGESSNEVRQWIVDNLGKNLEDEVHDASEIEGKIDERLYTLFTLTSKGLSYKEGDKTKYILGSHFEDMDQDMVLLQLQNYLMIYDQLTQQRGSWEKVRDLIKSGSVGEAYELIIRATKLIYTQQKVSRFWKTLVPDTLDYEVSSKLAGKIGAKVKEAGHDVADTQFIKPDELRNALQLYSLGKYDDLKQRYPVQKKIEHHGEHEEGHH